MAENCQNIMRGLPLFMDKSNIASMFEMLDSSNKGSISFVQYKEALKTLGLCTAEEVLKDDGHGVMFEKFRNEVRSPGSGGCTGAGGPRGAIPRSVSALLTLCNPMDCSPQAPLSMGPWQEYWSGLPFLL